MKLHPSASMVEFEREDDEVSSINFKDSYAREEGNENEYDSGKVNSKSKSDDTPDEQLRLLYVYFKDMSVEPLFTAQEEVEISAKIKKCESRSRELVILVGKLADGKVK